MPARKHYAHGDIVVLPEMQCLLAYDRVLTVDPAARYTKFISDFITTSLCVDGVPTGAELTVFGTRPTPTRTDSFGVQLRVPATTQQMYATRFYRTAVDLCLPDDKHIELTTRRIDPYATTQMYEFMADFAPDPLQQSAGAVLYFANMMAFYLND